MSLSQLQILVDDLVRDEPQEYATNEQRDRAIDLARMQYGKDRPRPITETLTADNVGALPLPTLWEPNFSQVKSAKYEGGRRLTLSVIETLAGHVLGAAYAIAPGTEVSVVYNAAHEISDLVFTPATTDIEAIAAWAAACILDQLATEHAGDQDSIISTDAVNFQTQSRQYASRANAQRSRYYEILDIKKGAVKPASAIIDMDSTTSRGRDRLFHQGKYR